MRWWKAFTRAASTGSGTPAEVPTRSPAGETAEPAWVNAPWDPQLPLAPAGAVEAGVLPVLEPGEQVLWTGRCRTERGLREQSAGAFAFWGCATGVVSAALAITAGLLLSATENTVAALTFALFCAGIFAGRLLDYLAPLCERGALYAVTDRRALRVRLCPWRRVTSFQKVDPLSLAVTNNPDGTGSVLFADEPWQTRIGTLATPRVGFFGIPDPRRAEKILLASLLRTHAGKNPPTNAPSRTSGLPHGLRSPDPGPRAAALAQLLQREAAEWENLLRGARVDLPLTVAVGIVGLWRPIGRGGARVLARALDGDADLRGAATQALARLGPDAVASLIAARPALDQTARDRLLEALTLTNETALAQALATGLLSQERDAAVQAADGLPALETLDALVPDAWVRAGQGALDPRLALIQGNGQRARYWAAEALARLAASGAAARVRDALAGSDPADGPTALARAHAGDPAGVGALVGLLNHATAAVRRAAAVALGALGAAAAPALEALRASAAHAPDEATRKHCRESLRRIETALGQAPAEMEAAAAPGGTGTELEASPAAQDTPRTAAPDRLQAS